jgi:hypothetical protein
VAIYCRNGQGKVKGQRSKFKAHKIILSASSNYFREQLKGNNNNQRSKVKGQRSKFKVDTTQLMMECSEKEMEKILEFIYTGQTLVDKKCLNSFLEVCRKLQIKGLPGLQGLPGLPQNLEVESAVKDISFNVDNTVPDLLTTETVLKGKIETVRKKRNLVDFPPELMINILSYVSTADVLNNVAQTSKYFNKLSKDPLVHLTVSLVFNVDPSAAAQFLTWASHIQELNICSFREALFEFEAGVPFDNFFFDNYFDFLRQLKNGSFLGPVFVHVTG